MTDPKDVMIISRRTASVGAGIATVALATSLLGSPADAATAPSVTAPSAGTVSATVTTAHVPAAAGWLSGQFESSGTHLPSINGTHFQNAYGKQHYANYGENDDVIFALAAAKAGVVKAAALQSFLERHAQAYTLIGEKYGPSDGAIGKLAVGAEVTGANPTSFGGYNLLARLKKDECASGSTTCTPGSAAGIYSSISESFVLIAEARAGGAYAPSAAAKAYFASLQCRSGGFTSGTSSCTGAADVDATSYAIMAMTAMHTKGAELNRAVAWLQGQQKPSGYWFSGKIANTNSTGLAASALQGVGAGLGKAREWLGNQQHGRGWAAGAMRYDGIVVASTTSATSPSVLATAQGVLGLVDGSTLARLSARGSKQGVSFYAPVLRAQTLQHRGHTYHLSGAGFSPSERVRITRDGTWVATAHADALGSWKVSVTLGSKASKGSTSYVATGLYTHLVARHPVRVA